VVGHAASSPARRTNQNDQAQIEPVRRLLACLTDALAAKLHGDLHSEYRLEWTEEERLDSAFLVVSALHMEALRRRGVLDVRKVPPDPWGRDAVFECRLTGGRLVRRLNAWALMKVFLPKAWRCPPDFEISEAADRRMERLMSSANKQPGQPDRCFRAGRQVVSFLKLS